MYYPVSAPMIEAMILSVCSRQDSYGYALAKAVQSVSKIKESALYPILKKLESEGYLETYSAIWNSRARKYYRITEAGKKQLDYLRKEWVWYEGRMNEIIMKGSVPDDES